MNNLIIKEKEIIVISFDEESRDYNLKMITDNSEFCNNVIAHNYVVLCTQKSKSASTLTQTGLFSAKHFAHIFSDFMKDNNYKLVQKYDTSILFSAELSENISLRTRVYKKNSLINSKIDIKFREIRNGSFRNVFRNTASNTALLTTFNINGKKYNIVNTDLFSLKDHHREMYNDGLFYKQQQFLAIIEDFKLYDKYNERENIIIAGSLKFNIYPLKMTNVLTQTNMKILSEEINKKISNSTKEYKELKKYNELYKYLNQLTKYYTKNVQSSNSPTGTSTNTKNVQSSNSPTGTSTNTKNNIKKINSINSIISKYEAKYDKIKKLLEEFKKNLKMYITGYSSHEENKTGLYHYNPFFLGSKSSVKGTESFYRGVTPMLNFTKSFRTKANESFVRNTSNKQQNLKPESRFMSKFNTASSLNYKTRNTTLSAKERILYALTDNKPTEYNIYDYVNSKNARVHKNKLVTLSI